MTPSSPRKKHMRIYHSYRHVLGTLLVILVPFVFLVFFSAVAQISLPAFLANLGISMVRVFMAYAISVVVAWILAVLFYRGKRASVALPFFDILQSLPSSALLPLAVLAFGKTNTVVISFLVFTIIWPILFSLISGLKLLKEEWEESVEIGGLRGWLYVKHFLIPASIPSLITGTIIGLGEGWEALVTTEIIVGIQSGLGSFFTSVADKPTVTVLGVLALLIVIFSINKLLWLPLLEYSHKALEE